MRRVVILFVKLFGCWCHSPVPTLTLCLLSHCYEQAATLVHIISSLDTSADTLLELDKLIQMIESPIFSDLRLRLLCPSENRALIEALYGILMLIPQTSSFDLLRSRLACVPPVHLEGPPRQSKQNRESTKIDFNELLIHFKTTQEKHQQFRREVLKERLKSNFQKSELFKIVAIFTEYKRLLENLTILIIENLHFNIPEFILYKETDIVAIRRKNTVYFNDLKCTVITT
ncbi:Protein VAC14-like protein [Armadillidium vulgare]|nr:Protein VAC14-like protein [Armadillidium vulgare]